MGGVIASNYTKRFPDNVKHLLLAGPAAVKVGAYTLTLFGSTSSLPVGYGVRFGVV